jgi:hypothetical protein
MSAEGKINTVNLTSGTTIMVVPIESLPGKARPSLNKRKGAVAMTVYEVEPIRVGKRKRLAYDVKGISDGGTRLVVEACGGNQTFWRAR